MSADSREPGLGRASSDRRRVLSTNVQPSTPASRSSQEQDGASVQPNWEQAFKFLSAELSKAWINSDCLVLIAYSLKDKLGDDIAFTFVDHLRLNREKITQEFMG